MDTKRFILTGVVVFVVFSILDYLIHMVILGSSWQQYSTVFRSAEEAGSYQWAMWLSRLILSFMLVFVFSKGYEGKGIGEGFRFGVYMVLLITLPVVLIFYSLYPFSFGVSAAWFVLAAIEMIIVGIIIAALYKPKAAQES